MPAILDLTWIPSTSKPTPPAGMAPAIVRNSTYTLSFRLWANAAKTVALDVPDGAVYSAQLRANRVKADETPGDPLAEAVIVVDTVTVSTTEGDVEVPRVSMTFTKEATKDLAAKGFWDMDQDVGDIRTTLYSGKFRVLDDTTREA